MVSDRNPQISPCLIAAESSEKMVIADAEACPAGKEFSVPGFLRKVFTEELGGDDSGRQKHKLLVIAVHAVILESGFLGFDVVAKNVVSGHLCGNVLPGNALFYTLPDITENGSVDGSLPHVKLMFQSVGKFLKIYGFLSCDSASATYSIVLNGEELVPLLNIVRANCSLSEEIDKEVFEFWRSVKDALALPLLTDFCEKLGFKLPPCFMRLPTELKLKILEHLPGIDAARVCCVSTELRHLGSSDDLWKKKYEEQFRRDVMLLDVLDFLIESDENKCQGSGEAFHERLSSLEKRFKGKEVFQLYSWKKRFEYMKVHRHLKKKEEAVACFSLMISYFS